MHAHPQVADTISKFAKKGLTPSQIGVLLRDSHGIAQVKSVTGNKILRILKGQGEHLLWQGASAVAESTWFGRERLLSRGVPALAGWPCSWA